MNTLKRVLRSGFGLLSVVLLLAMAGCGGGGGGTDGNGGDDGPPAVVIGSAGGTVVGPDGVTVVIPAGALSADTSLRITAADRATMLSLPAGVSAGGPAYDLLPHGTRFSVPATLSIPRGAADPPAGMSILKTNAEGTGWLQLTTTTTGTTHAALISTFSSSMMFCNCSSPSPPPVISIEPPPSVTVIEGSTVVFGVAAIGHGPLRYQWYKDGVAIPTQTDSSIALTAMPLGYSGANVRVIVTDAQAPAKTTTSAETIVTVTPLAPTIISPPGDTRAAVGGTATFRVATISSVAQNFVWERHDAGGAGWYSVGGNSNVLTLNNVQFADDQSEYRVKAFNGDLLLGAVSSTARLTVTATEAVPVITEHPRDQSTVAGRSMTLTVLATGGGLDYLWYRRPRGGNFELQPTEKSASLTLSNTSILDDGVSYRVTVRNTQGSTAPSDIATLTVAPKVSAPALRLAGGEAHAIALRGDAHLLSWGGNSQGQLGRGPASPVPGAIQSLPNVSTFAAGEYHNLALDDAARLSTWGMNDEGQLGDGSTARSVPQRLLYPDLKFVAAGPRQSVGILHLIGSLVSWGNGYHADGTHRSITTPEQFFNHQFTRVAIGKESWGHSLAIKDRAVWAWGENRFGELGSGDVFASTTPQAVPGLGGVVDVAAGGAFSLAMTETGEVYAWGRNDVGQTGTGVASAKVLSPQLVSLPGIVIAIAAGSSHAAALLFDGRVFVWGDNSFGKLGDGGIRASVATPIEVTGPWQGPIKSLGVGNATTFVLDSAGNVWGWGSNVSLQLGTQSASTNRPVQVPGVNLN